MEFLYSLGQPLKISVFFVVIFGVPSRAKECLRRYAKNPPMKESFTFKTLRT